MKCTKVETVADIIELLKGFPPKAKVYATDGKDAYIVQDVDGSFPRIMITDKETTEIKVKLKIKSIRIDTNHDREYFKVVEGPELMVGMGLCKSLHPLDVNEPYYSHSKDGEPDISINKNVEITIV